MFRSIGLGMVVLLAMTCLAAAADAGPIRVACIGDSITEGFTIAHPDKDGYPADLGRMLADGYDVKNFGAGGTTCTVRGDRPFIHDFRGFYEKATAFDPNVMVLMLGTNDSTPKNFVHHDEFEHDLLAFVDHFEQLDAHPKIVLCLPPPAFNGAYKHQRSEPRAAVALDPKLWPRQSIWR